MDKEFVLRFLEPHHIDHNEGLAELVEVFGLDTVKKFFLNCECIQIRVPSLAKQKELIKDVIRQNMKTMKPHKLQSKLGIGRDRFRKYLKEIEEEDKIRA